MLLKIATEVQPGDERVGDYCTACGSELEFTIVDVGEGSAVARVGAVRIPVAAMRDMQFKVWRRPKQATVREAIIHGGMSPWPHWTEIPPCFENPLESSLWISNQKPIAFAGDRELIRTTEVLYRMKFASPELRHAYQVNIFPPHHLGPDIAAVVLTAHVDLLERWWRSLSLAGRLAFEGRDAVYDYRGRS